VFKRSITLTLGLPAMLRAVWTREYLDARIILEQNADLRYLTISAKVQRMADFVFDHHQHQFVHQPWQARAFP
jgi:hypothetical protein